MSCTAQSTFLYNELYIQVKGGESHKKKMAEHVCMLTHGLLQSELMSSHQNQQSNTDKRKNWCINRRWGLLLFPWAMDQLHLQGKRQQGKMEVWGSVGWHTEQDKGSEGQNNGKALWWNWSATACLQGRRPPGPRRNLQRRTGKGSLHTNTHWYRQMGTIEAPSWPHPGHDSAGTHLTQTQRTERSVRERLLKVTTLCEHSVLSPSLSEVVGIKTWGRFLSLGFK